jgi:TRAP-type C4-dicarboxylate transport system permease small subunit
VADSGPDGRGTDANDGAPPWGGTLGVAFRRGVVGLNTLGSAWIFVLMILIDAESISRTFFNRPILGVIEMIEMSIVAIVFLQLPDALRVGTLTRSDGFFNLMLERFPRIGRAMGVVFELLGAVFVGLVLYGVVPELHEAYTRGYFVGQIGLFTFPEWPVKLVIVVGALAMTVQFLVFAYRYARPSPDGLPRAQPAAGD